MGRGRPRHRCRRADVGTAAEGSIVAGHVRGIGDITRPGSDQFCCIGRRHRAAIGQDVLEGLQGRRGIGGQSAPEQLVVEAGAEDAALRSVERVAELLISLDLLNQRVEARCVQVRRSIGLCRERVVEIVCARDEGGPEIRLCQIGILVVLDGAGQISWLLGEAAIMTRVAGRIARARRKRRIALHDINDVQQVIVGRSRGDIRVHRVHGVEPVDLILDLIKHGLDVNAGERLRCAKRDTSVICHGLLCSGVGLGRCKSTIIDEVLQPGGDRLHVVVELSDIARVQSAVCKVRRGVEHRADIGKVGAGSGGGKRPGVVGRLCGKCLEALVNGARSIVRDAVRRERLLQVRIAGNLAQDQLLVGVQNALCLRRRRAGADGIWRRRRKLSELPLDFRECAGIGRCDRHPVDGRANGDR